MIILLDPIFISKSKALIIFNGNALILIQLKEWSFLFNRIHIEMVNLLTYLHNIFLQMLLYSGSQLN